MSKLKKYLIILLLPLLVFTISCEDDLESENILGTWETSSVCQYQNIEPEIGVTCDENIMLDSAQCDDITESWISQYGNWNMTFNTDSSVVQGGHRIYLGYFSVNDEIESFGWYGSNPYTLIEGDSITINLDGDIFTYFHPYFCALITMIRKK